VNPDSHAAIVDLALFEAAQHPNGRALTRPRAPGGSWLLTGIIRCAGCRYALQGTTTSRGKRIYRCGRKHASGICPEPASVDADRVEAAAVEAFWKLTRDLEAEPHADTAGDLRALQVKLEKDERRLVEWASPEVQEAIGEIAEYATGLRDRCAARDEAAAELGRHRASPPRGTRVETDTLSAAWERMSTEQRRDLLGLRFDTLALQRGGGLVVYPAGAGPVDLPRRGFTTAPVLAPFPDPPRGTRVLSLQEVA